MQPGGGHSAKKTETPTQTELVLSPVILVPGDGGSQLWATLNKNSSAHVYCYKQADTFNLWLNLELLIPLVIDCFVDNMKLNYDGARRRTYNTPGVDIEVRGWGDPESVEWLDPTHNKAGAYFKDISSALVNLGYVKRKSLRGAPYDFRKAPNELGQWLIDFKKLVEDTYEINNNQPVSLLTHSMGSALTLVFLQRQDLEWRHKYIRRFISLAGAWAGSMKALKVFAMGDDLQSFALSGKTLRPEQISMPSTAWLLPSPLFWKTSEVLVETPLRTYNILQLQQYFNDIDYATGWEMRKDTLSYSLNFSPPEVELHCIYGNNLATVEKLVYKKADISGEIPSLVVGRGDGTVNERSLRACKTWIAHQNASVSTMELSGADHIGILSNKDVIAYVTNLLKPYNITVEND